MLFDHTIGSPSKLSTWGGLLPVTMLFYMILCWLHVVVQEKNITVIVEPAILEEELICTEQTFQPVKDKFQSWDLGMYPSFFTVASLLSFVTILACTYLSLIRLEHLLPLFFLLESKTERLEQVDFVICVGGDGTLLYTSSMFQVCYGLNVINEKY